MMEQTKLDQAIRQLAFTTVGTRVNAESMERFIREILKLVKLQQEDGEND